ncbi:MAG: lyase domain protein repeat-containing protein [Myxococcaceae bacterium]|nr:lyase domain protein repeat-containing protein [Myxococcaceae bacterium]
MAGLRSALFDVRPDERRPAALAFLALLGITAAHTLIETARDALFLTKVPIAYLPALYLAIAAAGLVTTRLGAALEARRDPAVVPRFDPVSTSLIAGAVITAAFWVGAASPSRGVLYALYVFSGLFAAWVAGRLWIRLGAIFTVVQAKRLYGVVGTGGVLGAVIGAAAARACLALIEVRHLLLIGAGLLVVTAIGPAALLPRPVAEPRRRADAERDGASVEEPSLGAQAREVARHPYLVRVLGIVLVTAAVGTAIDFVFKSEVARAYQDPHELASFLATVSLATNVASLVAQSIGVGVVMRVLGVHRALYVMPLLIGLGAGGAMLGLGFAAAIAMRGIDGTLRQSLQKTSVELLFVPLPDAIRARSKPIVDLVGQRGGQAVTSIAILGLVYVVGKDRSTQAVGVVVALLAAAWLLLARGIRSRYLDVFRATLQRGRIELSAGMPELDMTALEALIASLSSRKDAQVLGALDLLAAQSRGRLVPSLILFHPSKAVVLRALELLVESGRTDFVPVADRLLEHADPEVRTAALRARAAVEHDAAFLRGLLADPQAEIRATALVALASGGDLSRSDVELRMRELAASSVEVRRALTRALGEVQPPEGSDARTDIESALLMLAADDDATTRVLAATAMGHVGAPSFVPVLLGMLDERRTGMPAIEALAEMGDVAVAAVDAALDATSTEEETKWRLLKVLARSRSADAVPRLARRLSESRDTMLRTRILRALRSAQISGVDVPLDPKKLAELATDTVAAIARALAFRLAHERLLAETPAHATKAGELLQKLLRDKEIEGVDRLFLVLGLLHPGERFTRIQRGLASVNPKARASSRELLENVVGPPLREHVLAVVDDVADRERLLRIGTERGETTYAVLLGAMIDQGGEVGVLAAHHAAELGVRDAAQRLDASKTAFGDGLSTRDHGPAKSDAPIAAAAAAEVPA